jgi:hypothetical protein
VRILCIYRIQAASSRLRLYFAIQFLASLLRSAGASENSPQFQLRVNATKKPSPAGATDKIVAENSAAPPGLADFYRIKPAVETAGYSHPSPRDKTRIAVSFYPPAIAEMPILLDFGRRNCPEARRK